MGAIAASCVFGGLIAMVLSYLSSISAAASRTARTAENIANTLARIEKRVIQIAEKG